MHITLVSPYDPLPNALDGGEAHVGGVERVYAEVAPRLADRGHEITLVCSTDQERDETVHEGVHVIREPRKGTLHRAPLARLAPAIPDCDIVQTPATYPLTTPAILRHADQTGTPSVLDFHFEPHPETVLGRLAAHAYQAVGPRWYRTADRILARSKSYAESAPTLDTIPRQRVRIVPNGIDPERFTPRGPAQSGDYLLFVGRLVPYKGLDILIEALARDQTDTPLLVAGDGPLRSNLEAKARTLDVDTTFLGHVPEERLPELYRGALLTVLPSVNRQEAFGITLIESMASGTPVIASALPGVQEVAAWGGRVTPPGNATALATTITDALGSPLPRGKTLAAKIHEDFSWENVVDRTEAIYDEIHTLTPSHASRNPPAEVVAG